MPAAVATCQVFSQHRRLARRDLQAAIDAPALARARERRHDLDGKPHGPRHRDGPRGDRPQAHSSAVAERRLRRQPDHLEIPRRWPLSGRFRKPARWRGRWLLESQSKTARSGSTEPRPMRAAAGAAIASRACCSTAAWPTPSPTTRRPATRGAARAYADGDLGCRAQQKREFIAALPNAIARTASWRSASISSVARCPARAGRGISRLEIFAASIRTAR